jgi:hypothetical protein
LSLAIVLVVVVTLAWMYFSSLPTG